MATREIDWTTPAIRIAAAGFGAAVAGPLGIALGSLLGDALGPSASALIKGYAEKFNEEAAKKLLDLGTDSLVDRLNTPPPQIEAVYRKALRLSLAKVHLELQWEGFDDWFENWDRCLSGTSPLLLSTSDINQFSANELDRFFRYTLERLSAQGYAVGRNNLSLISEAREIPDELVTTLARSLPSALQENFRALIVEPQYQVAWRETQLVFQQVTRSTTVWRCISTGTRGMSKRAA
jgi:hypothetical protein